MDLECNYQLQGIISKTPATRRPFSTLPKVTRSESTEIIQVGKELSLELHTLSQMAKGSFVASTAELY